MANMEVKGNPAEKPTILGYAKKREDIGMSITRRWISMWQTGLRYFLSDQLHGRKRHQKWDWVVLNYIWPSIMQEMAKLSRNFKMVVSATEPDDIEIAEAFQGFLQWQWKKTKGLHPTGMRLEQLKAILDGKLCGYRVSKIYWDQKVRFNRKVFPPRWEGEVRHRLWPPSQFWASDKEYVQDGDCGTVRYVALDYAQSLWPDFKSDLEENSVTRAQALYGMASGGDTIRGQTESSGTYPSAGTGGIDRGVNTSPGADLLDLVMEYAMSSGLSIGDEEDTRFCRISETYLKDHNEIHRKEEIPVDEQMLLQSGVLAQNANGEIVGQDGKPITSDFEYPKETYEWDEPEFENGRYIVRNVDTLLNPEKEDQAYPHSTWPFVVTPHYLLPHMWQGSDAVTLYRHTQDHINVTVSHLVNNMKQFGDPRIAVEQNALQIMPNRTEKRYAILRGAGAIIRLARGGLKRFKIIDPIAPSPAVIALYQLFTQEYKNIQGLQDIAHGRKTKGNTTATEANFLAISSNDRIKLQNIFEEEWALQVINLVAEMDQYYYEVDRIVRIIGEDQILGAAQITQQAKDASFDIDIEMTEGMPFDEERQEMRYLKAYELLNNPAPNPMLPEMLRVLKISGWQKILKKMPAWQEYIAFEQLINSVAEGKLSPADALQMLIERMKEKLSGIPQSQLKKNGENNGNNRNSKST